MRRYRFEIDNVRAHLRSLWTVIGLEFLVILTLGFGWSQAPKQLTLHVPPDLRSGATLAVNEVPAANVYAFAFYIFQQLNRWSEDGARDYGKAIFRISAYVTPRYRAELLADLDLKGRQGELAYRVNNRGHPTVFKSRTHPTHAPHSRGMSCWLLEMVWPYRSIISGSKPRRLWITARMKTRWSLIS